MPISRAVENALLIALYYFQLFRKFTHVTRALHNIYALNFSKQEIFGIFLEDIKERTKAQRPLKIAFGSASLYATKLSFRKFYGHSV